METVSGNNNIVCFINFQNSLLQKDKVSLYIEDKLMDVCDLSNSNLVKEHDAIAVSYGHAQRDLSNSIELVEVLETLGGKDWVGTAMVVLITTANKSILRLHNINYPMTLS